LISWNVNGVRAVQKREGFIPVEKLQGDVICLQETKAAEDQVGDILDSYPYQYWSSAERKGYSGTAVFSRVEPVGVQFGLGEKAHDGEGRVIGVEFSDFWLVTVYTPNAGRGLVRLDYRLRWDKAFRRYLRRMEETKPVVFCGDLNVAHREIDLANPKSNRKNAGFTDEERESFSKTLDQGYLDTFRESCPDPGHYTWWSYIGNARSRNVGWRIDYFCVSCRLEGRVKQAFIASDVMGSDHCPVGLVLE
jgi:exodeoxyribonuclease-3